MKTPVQLREVFYVPVEAHLWYLYALIPIYLALPFLQWICRSMSPWVENVILYCWMGVTIVSTIWVAVERLSGLDVEMLVGANRLFYLFVGYILMKNKDKILGKTKFWFFVYVGTCFCNALFTYGFSVATNKHEIMFFQYRSALIMIAAMCMFLCIIKMEHVWKAKYIAVFCECSLGIYVMHILFLDIFKKHVSAQEVSAYWIVPALTLGILIATWSSIWLLRKFKIGRKIS